MFWVFNDYNFVTKRCLKSNIFLFVVFKSCRRLWSPSPKAPSMCFSIHSSAPDEPATNSAELLPSQLGLVMVYDVQTILVKRNKELNAWKTKPQGSSVVFIATSTGTPHAGLLVSAVPWYLGICYSMFVVLKVNSLYF